MKTIPKVNPKITQPNTQFMFSLIKPSETCLNIVKSECLLFLHAWTLCAGTHGFNDKIVFNNEHYVPRICGKCVKPEMSKKPFGIFKLGIFFPKPIFLFQPIILGLINTKNRAIKLIFLILMPNKYIWASFHKVKNLFSISKMLDHPNDDSHPYLWPLFLFENRSQ